MYVFIYKRQVTQVSRLRRFLPRELRSVDPPQVFESVSTTGWSTRTFYLSAKGLPTSTPSRGIYIHFSVPVLVLKYLEAQNRMDGPGVPT